jgi:hypothetical protein
MKTPLTVDQVIGSLPPVEPLNLVHRELPTPPYSPSEGNVKLGLAVESMSRHMTDEGWQIFDGLQRNGWLLAGHNLEINETDVFDAVVHAESWEKETVGTVLVQDKREWDLVHNDFRDPWARFTGVDWLRKQDHIFKLTILKDAQQRPEYHRRSAEEMGVHAWVVYYHPRIVKRLAPYVRDKHIVRTYHSIDRNLVPGYSDITRDGCLISGAVSGAYPLRTRLVKGFREIPKAAVLPHPGYHRNGCTTPGFLRVLSGYKVAICTASRYGYALRKIAEATACGCIVVTDLPSDEVLPEIDPNLVRVHPDSSPSEIGDLVSALYRSYNPERQRILAEKAKAWYDYREVTRRLDHDISVMRRDYPCL